MRVFCRGQTGRGKFNQKEQRTSRGKEVEGWLVCREPWDWGLGLKVRQRRLEVGEVGLWGTVYPALACRQ